MNTIFSDNISYGFYEYLLVHGNNDIEPMYHTILIHILIRGKLMNDVLNDLIHRL